MNKNTVVTLAIVLIVAWAGLASPPEDLSLIGLVEWAEVGGHIASGSGPLPAVASTGAWYIDLSTPTVPVVYRSTGLTWYAISGGGGGGGTDYHYELFGLSFAESGHTGFNSAASFSYLEASHTVTLSRLGGLEASHTLTIGSVTALLASQAYILDLVGTTSTALASHVAKQVDPHGASMTITQEMTIGSGPTDAYMGRISSGVIGIATYAWLPPTTATPPLPVATGTIWNDANVGKYKTWNGAEWQTWSTRSDAHITIISANIGEGFLCTNQNQWYPVVSYASVTEDYDGGYFSASSTAGTITAIRQANVETSVTINGRAGNQEFEFGLAVDGVIASDSVTAIDGVAIGHSTVNLHQNLASGAVLVLYARCITGANKTFTFTRKRLSVLLHEHN